MVIAGIKLHGSQCFMSLQVHILSSGNKAGPEEYGLWHPREYT